MSIESNHVCRTCRYWKTHTDLFDRTTRECGKVGLLDTGERVRPSEFAMHVYAADDYGLVARLETGPEFGCMRWEGKAA